MQNVDNVLFLTGVSPLMVLFDIVLVIIFIDLMHYVYDHVWAISRRVSSVVMFYASVVFGYFCRIIFTPLWLFHCVVARGRLSLPAPSMPHDRQVRAMYRPLQINCLYVR